MIFQPQILIYSSLKIKTFFHKLISLITLNKINYSQISPIAPRRSFVIGLFKPEPPRGPHTAFSCFTSSFPSFFPLVMGLLKESGQVYFGALLNVLTLLSWSWLKRESQSAGRKLSGNLHLDFPLRLPLECKFPGKLTEDKWLTSPDFHHHLPGFLFSGCTVIQSESSNVEGPTQGPLQLVASAI